MPSPKAPKVGGERALLKTWRQEGVSGTRAKLWLRIRRAASILIAVSLIGGLAYLMLSPMFLPKTYFAYFCADEVKPLVAPTIEFKYEDLAGFAKLQSALTPLQSGRSLLYARMATPELVQAELEGLGKASIGDDDALILFVSAHGLVRDGKAYLMCDNFQVDEGGEAPDNGLVEVSSFLRQLDDLPGDAKLVLLDAGRSDYAPRLGVTSNVFPEALKREIEQLNLDTVFVLTANSIGETSHVSHALRRSIFGYTAATGLQGAADLNKDGEIKLHELSDFVRFNVAQCVKHSTGDQESQTPLLLGTTTDRTPELHLLYTTGLSDPEDVGSDINVAQKPEAGQSYTAAALEFLSDEADDSGFRPVRSVAGGLMESVMKVIPGSKEEDAEKSESAENKSEEEEQGSEANREANRILGELALMSRTWKLTEAIAREAPSPVDYAPHLWRLHLDRLLWLEGLQQSGERMDERWLVDELRSLNHSLEDFEKPNPPEQPENVIDRIRLCRPTTPFGVNEAPTLALKEAIVDADPEQSLPPKLREFVSAYDNWTTAGEDVDLTNLDEILKPWDAAWSGVYEFQLIDTLRSDPELSLETIKAAFEARRRGEQVTADVLWGQGWAANLVEQADQLRLEAERLLVDKTDREWESRSLRNLQRARRLYLDAQEQLSTVRQATRMQHELSSRARDYLRWSWYGSNDSTSTAPSTQSLANLFAALNDLQATVDSSDRSRLPNTVVLERMDKDIEKRIHDSVEALTTGSHKAGDAERLDALLQTALLRTTDREKCISARLSADEEQMRSFTLERPPSTVSQSTATEKTRRVAEQLQVERTFFENFDFDADLQTEESLEVNTAGTAKLLDFSDALGKRLSALPGVIQSEISANSDLSDFRQRQQRMNRLRRAAQGLYLVEAIDLTSEPGNEFNAAMERDLVQPVRNALWFDLLSALHARYWRAQADAPGEELEQLQQLTDRIGEMASNEVKLPNQPELGRHEPARLDLQIDQPEIELIANDEATLRFMVNSTEEMPIWIVAEYDKDLIDVSGVGWTVLKAHEIRQTTPNNPDSLEAGYPYRPEARRGLSPTFPRSSGQSRPLSLRVKRLSAAKGSAALVLKAIGHPDFVRQHVPLRLPGHQELRLSIVEGNSVSMNTAGIIDLFANRIQELTFQVANTGSKPRSLAGFLYAPQQAPTVSIPSGSIESSAADEIFRRIGPRRPVAMGAQPKLSPDGLPVPLVFDFGSRENISLLGAEPKEGPIKIPLPHGLLLDLVDQETQEHTIRWIQFKVWRPRAFLTSQARYDAGAQQLTVIVEATNTKRFPDGEIEVDLEIGKDFLSARGGGVYSAILRAPSYRCELQAPLNGSWPRDIDPEAEDYLPVRVRVDGYPRGFVFHVGESTAPVDLEPIEDLSEVRIITPQDKSFYPASAAIDARFEVDAPEGFFDAPENFVEVGVDVDQDRELRDEGALRLPSDRQVQLFALKPTGAGTLSFEPRVDDFALQLPTKGIKDRPVNILGQFNSGGRIDQRTNVEITLDSQGPVIGAVKLHAEAEKLIVEVNPDDLTKTQSVEAGFESATEVKWEKGNLLGQGLWIVELKTEGRPPGEQTVLIRATDVVGNVCDFVREPWTKGQATTETKASRDAPVTPKVAKPIKNRVFGKVIHGTRPVTEIKVTLTPTTIRGAGAPAQPAKIGTGNTFDFAEVAPGTYTLSARGLSGGNRHKADLPITVSDQPGTPLQLEVKIR